MEPGTTAYTAHARRLPTGTCLTGPFRANDRGSPEGTTMKNLLLITIAAVLLVGTASAGPIHDAAKTGDLAGVQAE